MADTSKLNEITKYILEELGKEFDTKFIQKKVKVGSKGVERKFSGVSVDSKIIVQICHHSGRTKGGSLPVGKIHGLYAKCYLMEKAKAEKKFIYFTNKQFYQIFTRESEGIIEGIELKVYEELPLKYQEILNEVIKGASDEMAIG
ncbi:hypothetical protein [Desulfosporosinus hippei]|uniref:Restriction endonuclease n=1 Tax=Desulfosporosinus hippei DSM 8344 TaxID=1121419 RepID=A0A1G7Z5D5_9FIRM|nr:hypothetical protein [Desulfosporosinus hippei]SDH03799.1 hypothetical protein SAMN05443529_10910 [Desulfosporosinus hippei DSM 8344]